MDYIKAKTIVTRTKNNDWFGYEYNMNIYKGCNHGCIYCDSRCNCYKVDNFDHVRAKENALEIITNDLRSKKVKGVICSGAMSDPYNIFEDHLMLTRNSLKLINKYGFGVGLMTKSDLIARDIDLLENIKHYSPVLANLTVTTCDDDLCKILEPNAPVASKRFSAIEELKKANIFAGILLLPVLPFIEDDKENVIGIIEMAAESGANFIYPSMGVTLRGNQKEWYFNRLDEHFPGLKEKYDKTFGNQINCLTQNYESLMKIFKTKCEKYGIFYDMKDIIKASRSGYEFTQLSLCN